MAPKTVQVSLIGQPNVGKSFLFTRMTGVGVISSNYPGTTVTFEEATITRNDVTVHVHDLPGTYSLSKNSMDEETAIKMLSDPDNDAVLVVADATNLESSLVLCMEVIELGLPTVLILNKMDTARKRFDIDIETLSKTLGVPVMPVSAKTAEGVDALVDAVCSGIAKKSAFHLRYGRGVEKAAMSLAPSFSGCGFDTYGAAVKMLEGIGDFTGSASEETLRKAEALRKNLEAENSESPNITIGRDRYALSDAMMRAVVKTINRPLNRMDRLSDLMITPRTGLPILALVCIATFMTMVYVGSFLDGIISDIYETLVLNPVTAAAASAGPFWSAVVLGIVGSIGAILSLVIPYIAVFYILLGVLEDSGYLTRAVVLLDTTMHRFGLHGGAFIPMIVGIGCNVPAIMAMRTIHSRRERLIASTMVVIAVPCSAQIAIILGLTGKYAGVQYAFAIFLMLAALGCISGIVMNKILKKEPSNLAMELPDLAMPIAKNVLFKMWIRIKDFFMIAFPLLIVGSVIIELLLTYNILVMLTGPMSFLTVTMLGLPAVTIVAFIAGLLRKEMAAALLVILAAPLTLEQFMTPEQFVVFGIVMAVYAPCIATVAAMWRELGAKDTAVVMIASVAIAIAMGALANILFMIF